MVNNNTSTFTIDNTIYPITPQVYQSVQSYLYNQDDIMWVTQDTPHIKYGIKVENEEKCIKRLIKSILMDSEIGKHVLETTTIKPLSNEK